MLNTYNYKAGDSKQYLKINAVSGGILKNHPESWFERFHLNSPHAETRFSKPTRNKRDDDVIVLQMMVCGDMEVIAECVYRKDYEVKVEEGE